MSNFMVFVDDEYLCEYEAESFVVADLVGDQFPTDAWGDTDEIREIEVFTDPTWCEHDADDECLSGMVHDDTERCIVGHKGKKTITARVAIDGDGTVTGVQP